MAVLDVIEKGVDALFATIPRGKPSRDMMDQVRVIAHRGAHCKKSNCIENTDKAFARALELRCWGIELDVHATADDVLVVNHDPDLYRLWGTRQTISSLTFNQLRKLAPQVPSLQEIVARYGQQLHFFIELKAPFSAPLALQHTLQSLIPGKDYHLLTLNEKLAASLINFSRESILLVAGHNNVAHFCNMSIQDHYGGVLGHYLLLKDSNINELRLAKQKVGVGQVNSKFSLYRELNRGLAWLFSNNVELINHYLK